MWINFSTEIIGMLSIRFVTKLPPLPRNRRVSLIFRVNELSLWRMNFSRFEFSSSRVQRYCDERGCATVAAPVTYRPPQDDLPRQFALISIENPLEKLSRARGISLTVLLLPPHPPPAPSRALIRRTRAEITRHGLPRHRSRLNNSPGIVLVVLFLVLPSHRDLQPPPPQRHGDFQWHSTHRAPPRFESRGHANRDDATFNVEVFRERS